MTGLNCACYRFSVQESRSAISPADHSTKVTILRTAALWLIAFSALQFVLACSLSLGGDDLESVPQTFQTEQGPRYLAF
ncbi:MAG: hypothetical protein OXD31_13225, partial [Chloroflexi bacterium]|nr:hypothetical protein [Chloroflexota bacterium]